MVCEDDADEFEESTECGGIGGRGWKVASSGEMAVSLPLGAGGEHSLVSSITGVSKRSQGQMEKRGGGGQEPLRVFSRVCAPRPPAVARRGCRSTW